LVRAFDTLNKSCASVESAGALTQGIAESVARSKQAARSNIHAGTSSQRSASEPLSVQRKTTPSILWTAA